MKYKKFSALGSVLIREITGSSCGTETSVIVLKHLTHLPNMNGGTIVSTTMLM